MCGRSGGAVRDQFAVGLWPGQDAREDAEWAATAALARRRLTVWEEAGIEGAGTEPAVGLLDWVEDHLGSWDAHDYPSTVRSRVDGLLDAGRRGRERGMRLRETRGQIPPLACSACWALRHPGDHYFRLARDSAPDARVCELLDAHIAVLSGRYDRLSAEHHVHQSDDVILELGVLGPIRAGWHEPVTATVQAANTDAATVGEQIAIRLVADPDATFNGTLLSVRAGERWFTVADGIRDRTIIPRDGTVGSPPEDRSLRPAASGTAPRVRGLVAACRSRSGLATWLLFRAREQKQPRRTASAALRRGRAAAAAPPSRRLRHA